MKKDLIAKTSVVINAPKTKVWHALINPAAIKQYMFGTTAVSDWHEGSPIVWKGEWQGKAYEDKGVILNSSLEKHFNTVISARFPASLIHQITITRSRLS